MHLLLAPFLARVVLVEAGQVAIVALVQRLVADGSRRGWPSSSRIRSQVFCARCSTEVKAMSKPEPLAPSAPCRRLGLLDARVRSGPDVAPAGEQVLQVPFALAVADEHERSGHDFPLVLRSAEAEHVAHRIEPGLRPRAHSAAFTAPRANIPGPRHGATARCVRRCRRRSPNGRRPPCRRAAWRSRSPLRRGPVWPSRTRTLSARSMSRPLAAASPSSSAVPDGASTLCGGAFPAPRCRNPPARALAPPVSPARQQVDAEAHVARLDDRVWRAAAAILASSSAGTRWCR
jgi:hypothetical protein